MPSNDHILWASLSRGTQGVANHMYFVFIRSSLSTYSPQCKNFPGQTPLTQRSARFGDDITMMLCCERRDESVMACCRALV